MTRIAAILLALLSVVLIVLGARGAAKAETVSGVVVSGCGTPAVSYIAGRPFPVTLDTGGNVCFSGTVTVPLITNYELETGGNADLQTSYLLALKNAIGTPIPGNSHCQTTALAASLVCGATGARSLVDFTVTADATLDAAAWYIMIFDATSLPANGANQVPVKCYQVPSGQAQIGGNFGTGGINVTNGLVIGVSTTGCFTLTTSTHALFIGGSYQ